MSLWQLFWISLLAVWVVLTLVRQIPATAVSLTNWDLIGLIPIYRFFAPIPGRYDFHLLVRFEHSEGEFLSEWIELGEDNHRCRASALFNPRKRIRKAQLDLITDLSAELFIHEGSQIQVNASYSYLALLLIVERYLKTSIKASPGARYQFLILASCGCEANEMEPLMLSSFHRIE
jgi:hypothetical protein